MRTPNRVERLSDELRQFTVRPPHGYLWMDADPCVYCGKYRPKMNWDHITPASNGGRIARNLARACMLCNGCKGSLTALGFLLKRARERTISQRAAMDDLLRKRFGVTDSSLARLSK